MSEVHAMLQKVYGITIEQGTPTCETCGVTLEVCSEWPAESEPSYTANRVQGFCPKCRAAYDWKDYYVYTGFGNLEKIS